MHGHSKTLDGDLMRHPKRAVIPRVPSSFDADPAAKADRTDAPVSS